MSFGNAHALYVPWKSSLPRWTHNVDLGLRSAKPAVGPGKAGAGAGFQHENSISGWVWAGWIG